MKVSKQENTKHNSKTRASLVHKMLTERCCIWAFEHFVPKCIHILQSGRQLICIRRISVQLECSHAAGCGATFKLTRARFGHVLIQRDFEPLKICGALFKLFNEILSLLWEQIPIICSFIFYPINGQLKWQTLSRVSALEQRLKRRNLHGKQQDRLQTQG